MHFAAVASPPFTQGQAPVHSQEGPPPLAEERKPDQAAEEAQAPDAAEGEERAPPQVLLSPPLQTKRPSSPRAREPSGPTPFLFNTLIQDGRNHQNVIITHAQDTFNCAHKLAP